MMPLGAGHLACPRCSAPLGEDGLESLCPRCLLLLALPGATVPAPSRGAVVEELAAGVLIARRYRIVSLLGRGGMADVYRADDLKLGASIALKFLPGELADDTWRVQALKDEVRVARQVSHPNVCRVHDFGETDDGRPFLVMEYIDGEDLSKLCQRIGRLPGEKAIEVGREICAGLAAVHAQGLVHRDLKPANVMLDGRGRARLTDFGITAFRDRPGEFAGTPAYMAPELFEERPPSQASDIYSLGLVLYETLTGQRAITADTPEAARRSHRQRAAEPTGALFDTLDAQVQSALRACLSPNPAERPDALDIATALPGGNALQEALAAGHTPSPQDIAWAGSIGTVRMPIAAACLAAVLILMPGVYVLGSRVSITRWRSLPESPAALQFKVREHLRAFGVISPENWASGFESDSRLMGAVRAHSPDEQAQFLRSAPTSPIFFWYRAAPQPLVALTALRPTLVDPPSTFGEISIALNPDGSLISFNQRLPGAVPPSVPAGTPADWRPIFVLAHLDLDEFEAVAPRISPSVPGDQRLAWLERESGLLGPRRVEASLFRNRIVSFSVVYDRTLPGDTAIPIASSRTQALGPRAMTLMWDLTMLVGAIVAWWQVRDGRADLRGAGRLCVTLLVLTFAGHLLARERLIATLGEDPLFRTLPRAVFRTALTAVFYLALERFIRRHAPHQFIAWSRLLTGRFADPLVGRDVLIGIIAGLAVLVVFAIGITTNVHVAGPAAGVWAAGPMDMQRGVAFLLNQVSFCVALTLSATLAYAGALSVVPRSWMAAAILFIAGCATVLETYPNWTGAGIGFLAMALAIGSVLLVRLGTLAAAVMMSTASLLNMAPVSDRTSWRFAATLVPGLFITALAFYGFAATSGILRRRVRIRRFP